MRLLPSPLPEAKRSVCCAASRSSLSGLPDLHECSHPWVNVYLRAEVRGPLETELCAVLKDNGEASRQPVAPLPGRGWPFRSRLRSFVHGPLAAVSVRLSPRVLLSVRWSVCLFFFRLGPVLTAVASWS